MFVGCRDSCGGEFPLAEGFGEGIRGERRDRGGAGDVRAEFGPGTLAGLGSGEKGLPFIDGERFCIGRGEIGTFIMTASSGRSSSSSSHSASFSLTVLRFASCQDCRRVLRAGEGSPSMVRELWRERVRSAEGTSCPFEGDGERELRLGAARLTVVSDGADGDVKPLRDCFPGAASCVCGLCTALWTCVWRLGNLGFDVPVRSRKDWCAGCGCE
jgi:hypothetical protein